MLRIVSFLLICALTQAGRDNELRLSHACITGGRMCSATGKSCCDGFNCYKRSKRGFKRCIKCKEDGKPCRFGHHCCSNKCKNKICTSSSCGNCDMSRYEALDNDNFSKALELWIEDESKAKSMYGPVECWDVKKVTDMSLDGYVPMATFNEDLSCWETSQVTDMTNLFASAKSFNQSLKSWDTSSVTAMRWMFHDATVFNNDVSNWNVAKVIHMYRMFDNASSFNQNLNAWDVKHVTNMSSMFDKANSFNQDLSSWNVQRITKMTSMFALAKSFNQTLCWEVSTKETPSMFVQSPGCIDIKCCPNCDKELLC